jgi:hypothetical protein
LQPGLGPPAVKLDQEAPPRDDKIISLPDHSLHSVLEMTELLERILPIKDLKYNLTSYKKSFRASGAVDAFMKEFNMTREQATDFGVVLQKHELLDHVVKDHVFQDTDSLFFRLQCHQTPNILNSYRIWTERVDPNSMALLNRLKKQLNSILADHTHEGQINYKEAVKHKHFPTFCEAVCELQGVNLFHMKYETKLVRLANRVERTASERWIPHNALLLSLGFLD